MGNEEQNPRTLEAKIVKTSFRTIWSSRPVATTVSDAGNIALSLWNEDHVFLNVQKKWLPTWDPHSKKHTQKMMPQLQISTAIILIRNDISCEINYWIKSENA